MKVLFLASLIVTLPVFAYDLDGKVIKVTDGDTVTVMSADHVKHKVRLAGIDAPERKQPFGKKSKQMLSSFIAGKQVRSKCTKKDRYRRNICVIYHDSHDINEMMIANGGAWVYRRYYVGQKYYDTEKSAQDNNLGLWATTEAKAIPPWEWRRKTN